MVNRVLIRLKVVQLLYSYMLTRSEFKIEQPVETSSPDRRYSFQAYTQLLLLLLELSGRKVVADGSVASTVKGTIAGAKFEDSAMSKMLMANDEVRAMIESPDNRVREFDAAVPELVARLKGSTAYRVLAKIKKPEIADEIEFWTTALRTTMIKTEPVVEAMRANPNFTVRGMEMGCKMLVETLKGFSDTRSVLTTCRNDLRRSLDQAYELYFSLLWLPVEIVRAEQERLAANAAKYLPTDEDLHPDRRFADSEYISIIEHNPVIAAWSEKGKSPFLSDPILMTRLLGLVLQSDVYKEYMEQPGEKSIEEQSELWRKLLRNVILPSEDFAEALENTSIFWNDDIAVMSSFALKTLRQFSLDGNDTPILPEFKDEEDAAFGCRLFDAVVSNMDEYRALIQEFVNTNKWDTERLALMDMVILRTALAEVLEFPKIPLQVTANEYVEIANWYSTPRAGSFINGMLASITEKLRKEGKTVKSFKVKS